MPPPPRRGPPTRAGPTAPRYNMTRFSITLNEMVDEPQKYAPTDCRLRPDQRALEDGRYGDADTEKQRLEHKQRQARKVPLSPPPPTPTLAYITRVFPKTSCAPCFPSLPAPVVHHIEVRLL